MFGAAKKLTAVIISLCMLAACSAQAPSIGENAAQEIITAIIPESTPAPSSLPDELKGDVSGKEVLSSALDLASVRPMLNALAQAVIRAGEGFEEQCSQGLFTNYIYTLLRSGCIDETNSLASVDESGLVYTFDEQGLMQIYAKMINTGTYPGICEGIDGVKKDGSGAVFTLAPGEAEQSMLINGVTDLGEGRYSLFVTLWDDDAQEGESSDKGDYRVELKAQSDAIFGYVVNAIVSSEPTVATTSSPSVVSTARARLDVFFGYDSVEMLDELSPIMAAVVSAVDENEGVFTVSPSSPVVWRAMQLMVNTLGSRLPGVSVKDGKASILYDDMLLMYMDVFYNPGLGVPDIPEEMEDDISYSDGSYTFIIDYNDTVKTQLVSYEVSQGVSYFTMNDDGGFDLTSFNADAPSALFKYKTSEGTEYVVSLCQSASSNYGIGIFDVKQ